jgi:hypothetical protein
MHDGRCWAILMMIKIDARDIGLSQTVTGLYLSPSTFQPSKH